MIVRRAWSLADESIIAHPHNLSRSCGYNYFALGATLLRTAQLKTLPPSKLIPAMGSRTSTSTELAARGRILDRRGRILATSVVGYRLFADPATIWKRGNDKIREGLKSDPQASFPSDPFADAAASLSTVFGKARS